MIYSCLCIFSKLLTMTSEEIIKSASNYSLLSLSENWLMLILDDKDCYVFCEETLTFCTDYFNSGECYHNFDGESCIDFIPYAGVSDICDVCLNAITTYLRAYSIKLLRK